MQRHLTRSLMFAHPVAASRLLACISNEADATAHLIDLSGGEVVQRLQRPSADKPYLAFADCGLASHADGGSSAAGPRLLAGLAEGAIDIFAWQPSGIEME